MITKATPERNDFLRHKNINNMFNSIIIYELPSRTLMPCVKFLHPVLGAPPVFPAVAGDGSRVDTAGPLCFNGCRLLKAPFTCS